MPTPNAKYKKQSPWVGTYVQRAFLDREAADRNVSLADILRELVNARYNIDPAAEEYLNGTKHLTEEAAKAAVAQFYSGATPEPEAAL